MESQGCRRRAVRVAVEGEAAQGVHRCRRHGRRAGARAEAPGGAAAPTGPALCQRGSAGTTAPPDTSETPQPLPQAVGLAATAPSRLVEGAQSPGGGRRCHRRVEQEAPVQTAGPARVRRASPHAPSAAPGVHRPHAGGGAAVQSRRPPRPAQSHSERREICPDFPRIPGTRGSP